MFLTFLILLKFFRIFVTSRSTKTLIKSGFRMGMYMTYILEVDFGEGRLGPSGIAISEVHVIFIVGQWSYEVFELRQSTLHSV